MTGNRKKFFTGLFMMAGFIVVLIIFFSPVFGGKNGLDYLDNLYNCISKGSAYYIPDVRKQTEKLTGQQIGVQLTMAKKEQAEETAKLFKAAGAEVTVTGAQLGIKGDLGKIFKVALDDADAMYNNDGKKVSTAYGYPEKRVLYTWWKALSEMEKELKKQKKFQEAKYVTILQQKAIEASYNFYGIEPQKIGDRLGLVAFSLVFYVLYTLWYGFAIMYLFEGWGLQLKH